MLGSKISLIETLPQRISDSPVCEPETSYYLIDCYPYAAQGIGFGLLLWTAFWGSVIGVLMLVF